MPISRYDIITVTHPADLNAAMAADPSLTQIGWVVSRDSYALQAVGVGDLPIGSATDYHCIDSGSIPDLIAKVNAAIADGFQPIGGVVLWHHAFVQAVGKVEAGTSGGTGGGGNDIEIPEGKPFEVLGFDAANELKSVKSGMAQWLGEDRQIGGNAFDFIPVTYLTGGGQRVSQGAPNLRGLSSSPVASSVASRDAGGVLSGNTASKDVELPNLKQVREMIEDASGGPPVAIYPEGKLYEVMSFDAQGDMQAKPMSMELWTGTDLPKYDAAMNFVPITNFAAGGASSTQSCGAVDVMPMRFAIAQRDMNGCLGVERANQPYHATNLLQVEEMIATSRKAIEDGIIDIINGAINGASTK